MAEKSGVPVIVRLGVLSLFPILEALKGLEGVDYKRLTSTLLKILREVVSSLEPFALVSEPADALDAFQDLVQSLIREHHYQLSNREQAELYEALVCLALARGSLKHLLQAVDTLLRIPLDSTQQLHLGNLLNQIASHNVDNSLSLLFSGTLEHTWAVYHRSTAPTLAGNSTSLAASDGFLWIFTGDNLLKVGNGFMDSIRGHVYGIQAFERELVPPKRYLGFAHQSLYIWARKQDAVAKPGESGRNRDRDRERERSRGDRLRRARESIQQRLQLLRDMPGAEASFADFLADPGPPMDLVDDPAEDRGMSRSRNLAQSQLLSREESQATYSLAVYSSELQESGTVNVVMPTLDTKPLAMCSDGRLLCFLTRRPGVKLEGGKWNGPRERAYLEQYDPAEVGENSNLKLVSSVHLEPPEKDKCSAGIFADDDQSRNLLSYLSRLSSSCRKRSYLRHRPSTSTLPQR